MINDEAAMLTWTSTRNVLFGGTGLFLDHCCRSLLATLQIAFLEQGRAVSVLDDLIRRNNAYRQGRKARSRAV